MPFISDYLFHTLSYTDHFLDPQKECKYVSRACACVGGWLTCTCMRVHVHLELTEKLHTCTLPAAVGYSSDLEDYDIQLRLQTGYLERGRNVAQVGESQFLEASVPIPRADLRSPLVQSTQRAQKLCKKWLQHHYLNICTASYHHDFK